MNTLAGAIGLGPAEGPRTCRGILQSQSLYGSGDAVIVTVDDATFGASEAGSLTSARDHKLLINCDVRLDNADELCRALSLPYGQADAHIVHAAWTRWGKASLDRIYGDYALATYDSETRTLTFARDITGQRPLFYKQAGSALAFASMPVGLKTLWQRSAANLDLLAEYLEQRSETQGISSFLEGIEKVRSGEIVEFRGGAMRRRFHWEYAGRPEPGQQSQDYVEEYRALLDSSVASRIKGRRRPVASQLSSGWDSSAVTATAARLLGSGKDLIAFTAAPLEGADDRLIRHRISDESPLAAETARMHGIRHVVLRRTDSVLETLDRHSKVAQHPALDPFNMGWWMEIQRHAGESGASTLLTGEMGNLTINIGGLFILQKYILAGRWLDWWRESRLLAQRPDIRWRGLLLNSFMPWAPRAVLDRLNERFRGVPPRDEWSFVRPHWSDKLRRDTPPSTRLNLHDTLTHHLRSYDFGAQRKAALAFAGVEEADPLSDRRLIEFALRLPPEQMLWGGCVRPLARSALSDRLPASVLNAHARGLQSTDWHLRLSGREARAIYEMIAPNSRVQELLDLPKVARAIESWPTSDFNQQQAISTFAIGLVRALSAGHFILSQSAEPGAG